MARPSPCFASGTMAAYAIGRRRLLDISAGLVRGNQRKWADDDVAVLQTYAGVRSAMWIAQKLDRSEASIVLKLKRLGLSRRVENLFE